MDLSTLSIDTSTKITAFLMPWITILLSLILALMLKEVASSIVKGLKFKMSKVFVPGDVVLLDGDEAIIIKVGLTTTVGVAKTVQDSFGTIIHEDDYPTFTISQKQSNFLIGERIISDGIERDLYIANTDVKGYIKVNGTYNLSLNEIISGKESGSVATIDRIINNSGRFKVNYANKKDIGWEDNIGKLNEDFQVIADNDYYQNLSYTIKSPITWKELSSPVNNLVHTSGMKNFSDTGISSTATVGIGS